MAKRAKVLRDPYLGPGLLMVEGRQYPFLMGGLWRSQVPAKPGLWVDVDFDEKGNICGITAVPDAQLAEEQAQLRNGARAMVDSSKSRLIRFLAVVALGASWIFLTAVSVQVPFLGNVQLTFWEILGYLNSGSHLPSLVSRDNPDPGVYGFIAVAVLVGPLLGHVSKHRGAELGGLMPLIFTAVITVIVRTRLPNFNSGLTPTSEGSLPIQMASAFSAGMGMYVSGVVALYLAVISVKKVLVNRPAAERELVRTQEVAA